VEKEVDYDFTDDDPETNTTVTTTVTELTYEFVPLTGYSD
jgi:hypothetical protein